MSLPNNNLITPQTFPRIETHIAPIPKSPTLNYLTLVDEDGTEWCESFNMPNCEPRDDDEDIPKVPKEPDITQEKQLAVAQKTFQQEYRAKIFKNVIEQSIPPKKK